MITKNIGQKFCLLEDFNYETPSVLNEQILSGFPLLRKPPDCITYNTPVHYVFQRCHHQQNVICVVFVVILVSLVILVCVIIEVYDDPVVCEVIVVAFITLLCRGTLN